MKLNLKNKKAAAAIVAGAFGIGLLGSSTAMAMWMDESRSDETLTIHTADINMGVNNAATPSAPTLEYGNATWYQSDQDAIIGEKVMLDGAAKWPITATLKSSNTEGWIASLLRVKVTNTSIDDAWLKHGKFALSKNCDAAPAASEFGGVDAATGVADTELALEGPHGSTHNLCLWGQLPDEARGTYTVTGDSPETRVTDGKPGDPDKRDNGAFYENEVTVKATGDDSGGKVSDKDVWDTDIQRFRDPKAGEVKVLFRPVTVTGVCQVDTESEPGQQ